MADLRLERRLRFVFLGLALAAVAPVFRHPAALPQSYDWRYFASTIESARRSLLWFHQVPLWNPYSCGGAVLLANPQSLAASPLTLLAIVFGTALGIKIALVLYFCCAFDGMYRLARSYGCSRQAALLASVLFGTGGWLALHISSGQANFASAALFPYLLVFFRRAAHDQIRWAIPLGAVAAWIVCDGGTSTPAMATVLLATVAVIDAVTRRSARPLLALAVGALVTAALSAFRLFPALEFAIDHPRRHLETESTLLWQMLRDGYWWRALQPVPDRRYWFHEYGWRLSYVTPPLILWSLRVNKTRSLWIVAAVGAVIVAGNAIPYGPWWLLAHLPLFRDLRVPSRYAILFALAFPLLCAAAFDDLRARLAMRSWARMTASAIVLVAAVDGLAFDWYCFSDTFAMNLTVAERGTPFHQVQSDWRSMMTEVMAGHGAVGCDEEAPLQRAARLDLGPGPQVRLIDAAAGALGESRWSPNAEEVEVALARPGTVLFNQNWNEHWKTTRGEVVKWGDKWAADRDGGRLAVAVPEGSYSFAVYYRPRSFVWGSAISGVAFPVLLVSFLVRREEA